MADNYDVHAEEIWTNIKQTIQLTTRNALQVTMLAESSVIEDDFTFDTAELVEQFATSNDVQQQIEHNYC